MSSEGETDNVLILQGVNLDSILKEFAEKYTLWRLNHNNGDHASSSSVGFSDPLRPDFTSISKILKSQIKLRLRNECEADVTFHSHLTSKSAKVTGKQ